MNAPIRKITNSITTTTTTHHRYILSPKDILALLSDAGISIPPVASVTITIPSGGDYSGMSIDLPDIHIEWTTCETKA